MKTHWMMMLGAAALALSFGSVAEANHYYGTYGGYGYGNYGYGYPTYNYSNYGYSGYFNRTDAYHYSNPRVTTGYGYSTYYAPTYYAPRYYGNYGAVNVGYPSGGVHVNYGRRGGGVSVYGRWGGINIGW